MHPSSSPASKMNPFPFKSCLTFHLKGVILIKLRPFPFLNGQPDTIWLPTWHHGQAWIIWHLGPKVWISSWSSSYHSSSQSFPSRLQMVHILVPRNSIIDIMDTPDGRARQSSPELPVLILSRAYIYSHSCTICSFMQLNPHISHQPMHEAGYDGDRTSQIPF